MSDVERSEGGTPAEGPQDASSTPETVTEAPEATSVRKSIAKSLSMRRNRTKPAEGAMPDQPLGGVEGTPQTAGAEQADEKKAEKTSWLRRGRAKAGATPEMTTETVSPGHLGSVAGGSVQISEKPPTKRRPKGPHQTRKARLRISRVDPWSVMKTSLLFGVAGWIIFIVATWVVFTVLEKTGLYEAINDTIATVFAPANGTLEFSITDYVNTTRATALATLIGAVNAILFTALATIFAFLYNLSANVMGGIEVTLAED